jgi:hypothetical protein
MSAVETSVPAAGPRDRPTHASGAGRHYTERSFPPELKPDRRAALGTRVTVHFHPERALDVNTEAGPPPQELINSYEVDSENVRVDTWGVRLRVATDEDGQLFRTIPWHRVRRIDEFVGPGEQPMVIG